jgi:hypothetical protein
MSFLPLIFSINLTHIGFEFAEIFILKVSLATIKDTVQQKRR